jgi:hypothetical protein
MIISKSIHGIPKILFILELYKLLAFPECISSVFEVIFKINIDVEGTVRTPLYV